MKNWAAFFTPAGVSGDNFTTDGDISPEDIIASRVTELLQADTKLQAIFGPAIELMETRPLFDFRQFPRLQVYSSSTSESQSPTSIDVNEVRVFVSIRFDALNISVLAPYEASISTVRKYIAITLKGLKSLKVKINGAIDVPVAMELRLGATNWLYDPQPSGNRIAGTLEMEFLYLVHVDHRTQRIEGLRKSLP